MIIIIGVLIVLIVIFCSAQSDLNEIRNDPHYEHRSWHKGEMDASMARDLSLGIILIGIIVMGVYFYL